MKGADFDKTGRIFELYAIKSSERNGRAPLEGDVITDAKDEFDSFGKPCVSMSMNTDGSRRWAVLTKNNVGKSIAIVLDDYVYSAPNVNGEITDGHSLISGHFTPEVTKDLANVLRSGKMPAPARIVQEDIVGPSLGQESINQGIVSFVVALILLMVYMCAMYGLIPGMVANCALVVNFGTDTSLVKVFIGGKKAVLISAKSNFIYCMVPAKSYEGTVSVTVGDQTATASEKFHYNREMMVSTLYGKVRDDGKYDVVDGAFDESFINYYGVQEPTWFSFNPNDSTELYMSQDNGKPIRIFDLDEKVVRTGLTTGEAGIGRMRTLSWTADGDTLIVASDDGGGGDNDKDRKSAIYVTKNGNGEFRNAGVLAAGRQCNGVAIHPVNHEMYYNNFSKGVLYRFDYHKWGVGPENCMAHREYITTIQDNEWEFNIVIHPSGDYAYLVVINRHYIMRMNYDKAKKHSVFLTL